jgi:hypothetical protein
MTVPLVSLAFDGECRHFRPGETLSGSYLLEGLDPAEIKAVELSVLWYTEGKGEEDLAVHFFERSDAAAGAVDLGQSHQFSTRLPVAPLSYAGVIVKVCWCVRVRVFLAQGKDLLAEEPFQLGEVPAAREVET